MKKNSIFINVGRGGTVNENDLLNALKTKKILGAGLDVVTNEPIKSDSPLLRLKNVLITLDTSHFKLTFIIFKMIF